MTSVSIEHYRVSRREFLFERATGDDGDKKGRGWRGTGEKGGVREREREGMGSQGEKEKKGEGS